MQFASGAAELLKGKQAIFIEIGPGNVLSSFIRKQQGKDAEQKHEVLHLVRHSQEQAEDDAFLLEKIGKLWIAGAQIDWKGYYGSERRQRVALPTYPFERQRYSVERTQLSLRDMHEKTAPRRIGPSETETGPKSILPAVRLSSIQSSRAGEASFTR